MIEEQSMELTEQEIDNILEDLSSEGLEEILESFSEETHEDMNKELSGLEEKFEQDLISEEDLQELFRKTLANYLRKNGSNRELLAKESMDHLIDEDAVKFNESISEMLNAKRDSFLDDVVESKQFKVEEDLAESEEFEIDYDLFEEMLDEAVEQFEGELTEEDLEELSKATLTRYIKKASTSAASRAHKLGRKEAESDEVDRFTNRHATHFIDRDNIKKAVNASQNAINRKRIRMTKRFKGINTAVDKLAKG